MTKRVIMICLWTLLFFLFSRLAIAPLPSLLPNPVSPEISYNVCLAVTIAPFSLAALGLFLVFFGFLPRTRKPVVILLRASVGQPGEMYMPVEAVRVRGGAYRILSTNADPDKVPWEFWTGETVWCAKRCMPDGQEALVATQRSSHAA